MLAALVWTLATIAQASGPAAPGPGSIERVSAVVHAVPEYPATTAWMLADWSSPNPTLDEEDEDVGDGDDDGTASLHPSHGWARHGVADGPEAVGLRTASVRPLAAPPSRLSPLALSARLRR